MGKNWRIGVGILLGVFAAGLVWTLSMPKEPLYLGKSINYWLGAAKPEIESNGQIRFIPYQFPKANTNAVPGLVRALNKKDGIPQHIHAFVWSKSPTWLQMRMRPALPDSLLRVRAVGWLGEMREQARPAIPSLIQVMQNDTNVSVRSQVVRALIAIDLYDPAVRQALSYEAAQERDASLRIEVLEILKM